MYYINYFFLYSIFGHLIESVVYFFHNGESGILFCPWTPIYGFGVLIILLCFNFIKKINNLKLRILLIFLSGFLLLSFLEFMGGIIIEKIWNVVFWSYDGLKFNIGHYISLEISFCWGISALLVIMLLPLTDKIVKKIPRFVSWLLILLMFIDLIFTIIFK